MLEAYTKPDSSDKRFYVFNYNCWQYDYYEEPAIAIVASMLDMLNNADDLEKEKAKMVMKEITGKFIENRIGINLIEKYEDIKDKYKDNNKKRYDFDELFSFKSTVDFTRKKIKELADERTILFIVDELDRCMPEYSIKVLERLHHLFDDIENVIVLLAIDSRQLEYSVRQIYGNYVDTQRYLKKFISFSVELNVGEIQDSILDKYIYYFTNFNDFEDVASIIKKLINLSDIDIRNLDKLIEKIDLIHRISFNGYQGSEVLLFEMVWGLMKCKLIQAENAGIDTKYLRRLTWIPQIDKSQFVGLEQCISDEMIEYLKELKKNAVKSVSIKYTGEEKLYVRDDAVSMVWYILDMVLADERSFAYINEDRVRETVDLCAKFCELGKKMW